MHSFVKYYKKKKSVKIEEEGNSLSLVFEDQEQKQLECI